MSQPTDIIAFARAFDDFVTLHAEALKTATSVKGTDEDIQLFLGLMRLRARAREFIPEYNTPKIPDRPVGDVD